MHLFPFLIYTSFPITYSGACAQPLLHVEAETVAAMYPVLETPVMHSFALVDALLVHVVGDVNLTTPVLSVLLYAE